MKPYKHSVFLLARQHLYINSILKSHAKISSKSKWKIKNINKTKPHCERGLLKDKIGISPVTVEKTDMLVRRKPSRKMGKRYMTRVSQEKINK